MQERHSSSVTSCPDLKRSTRHVGICALVIGLRLGIPMEKSKAFPEVDLDKPIATARSSQVSPPRISSKPN